MNTHSVCDNMEERREVERKKNHNNNTKEIIEVEKIQFHLLRLLVSAVYVSRCAQKYIQHAYTTPHFLSKVIALPMCKFAICDIFNCLIRIDINNDSFEDFSIRFYA